MPKIQTTTKIIKLFSNWLSFIADYLKLSNNKYIIYKLRNGISLKTRSGSVDKNIIFEILIDKVYTPKGFEINSKDTIVDVGAHIGVFSVYTATLAKQGKVYAIEPMPDNYALLQANIELNNLKNIITINEALSADNEGRNLNVSNSTGGHSFIFSNNKNGELGVNTESLSVLFAKHNIQHIDLLKMDCEGAEYEILFNTPKETMDKIDKISMECHDIDTERNSSQLKQFLESNGFQVTLKTDKCIMLYAKKV
ncbi:MAG: FkbM family methyltransferase [bacterium]|nr:FkbM family methyltransferase [bacterium]